MFTKSNEDRGRPRHLFSYFRAVQLNVLERLEENPSASTNKFYPSFNFWIVLYKQQSNNDNEY